MHTRMGVIAGMVLWLGMGLSAMEIHNEAHEDQMGSRTETGVYEDDYLFMGDALRFSGEAQDLVFLGKDLTFSGKTTLGLVALGKHVNYSGEAGNGITAGCKSLTIDGPVKGANYIGCESLRVGKAGSIEGNLFVGCANVRIEGPVNGDIFAGAGELVIDSEVNGDVKAYVGRLTIGEHGKINGDLTYSSREKLSEEELARVSGTVVHDEEHAWDADFDMPAKAWRTFAVVMGIAMFFSCAVVGSLLLFFPAFRHLDRRRTQREFWSSALWGLIPLLMFPAVIVLCLVTVIPIPFALILMLAAVPLLYIGYINGATLVGQYVTTLFKWKVEKRHYHFLIGLLTVAILSIIPFIEGLVFILVSSLGAATYVSFLLKRELPVIGAQANGD